MGMITIGASILDIDMGYDNASFLLGVACLSIVLHREVFQLKIALFPTRVVLTAFVEVAHVSLLFQLSESLLREVFLCSLPLPLSLLVLRFKLLLTAILILHVVPFMVVEPLSHIYSVIHQL